MANYFPSMEETNTGKRFVEKKVESRTERLEVENKLGRSAPRSNAESTFRNPPYPEVPEDRYFLFHESRDIQAGRNIVEDLRHALLQCLNSPFTPPIVTTGAFQDAETGRLFGADLKTKVTLRKPGHAGMQENIVLLQFDPNFMSNEVICRHTSCNRKNPEAVKCGQNQKRDLSVPLPNSPRRVEKQNFRDLGEGRRTCTCTCFH